MLGEVGVAWRQFRGRDMAAGNLDDHFALLGELERVADQVDEDLPQARGIADDGAGRLRIVEVGEVEVLLRRARAEEVEHLLEAGDEVEADLLEFERAGLDLREVENLVDDGEQAVAALPDRLGEHRLLLGQVGVEQQAGHADHAVHRRADFVAHVGQEGRLGDVGRVGLLLRLLQFVVGLVECAGALDHAELDAVVGQLQFRLAQGDGAHLLHVLVAHDEEEDVLEEDPAGRARASGSRPG